MRYAWVAILFASCTATTQQLSMPDIDAAAVRPESSPPAQTARPKIVPYPGLEVGYVANGDGEIYFCRERFYCYFDGNWFRAETMKGPWDFVEMKYVPGDLFRARGHLPASLEQRERDDNPLIHLVGGSD